MAVKPSVFHFEVDISENARKIEQAIDAALVGDAYRIEPPTSAMPVRWTVSGVVEMPLDLIAFDLAVPIVRKLYQNAGWDDIVVTLMSEGLYFRLFYTKLNVAEQAGRVTRR